MFNANMFAVNADASFTYNNSVRTGLVIEVAVQWVRMDIGNGQFRTFRYERMS